MCKNTNKGMSSSLEIMRCLCGLIKAEDGKSFFFFFFFQTPLRLQGCKRLRIICKAQLRPVLQMQFCHTCQTVSPDFRTFSIKLLNNFSLVSWLPVNASVKDQQPKRGFKQDVYSSSAHCFFSETKHTHCFQLLIEGMHKYKSMFIMQVASWMQSWTRSAVYMTRVVCGFWCH